jgi:hypothetical protein
MTPPGSELLARIGCVSIRASLAAATNEGLKEANKFYQQGQLGQH